MVEDSIAVVVISDMSAGTPGVVGGVLSHRTVSESLNIIPVRGTCA